MPPQEVAARRAEANATSGDSTDTSRVGVEYLSAELGLGLGFAGCWVSVGACWSVSLFSFFFSDTDTPAPALNSRAEWPACGLLATCYLRSGRFESRVASRESAWERLAGGRFQAISDFRFFRKKPLSLWGDTAT